MRNLNERIYAYEQKRITDKYEFDRRLIKFQFWFRTQMLVTVGCCVGLWAVADWIAAHDCACARQHYEEGSDNG